MKVYSTTALMGLYAAINRQQTFIRDLFFPTDRVYDTKEVEGERKPLHCKLTHEISDRGLLMGEKQHGQDRDLAIVLDHLSVQDDAISRTEEKLAIDALVHGNPDRAPSNTIALTGQDSWFNPKVDPIADLMKWQKMTGADTVVLDPKTWGLLAGHPSTGLLIKSFSQDVEQIDLSAPSTAANSAGKLVAHLGPLAVYSYQDFYADDEGVVRQMLPDWTVIVGNASKADGSMQYGAIEDGNKLIPTPRYPKMWCERDADDNMRCFLKTQSAPLPVLNLPNATMCATVAS